MSEQITRQLLFMEDDRALARLLQKRLQRTGHTVDLAEDGRVGLEMMRDKRYDLIIVDQRMPIYNGLEVISELADMPDAPPAIMVTGAGDESIAVQALKLGAYDYVVKDAASGYMELLPTVIDQVFNKKKLEQEKERAEKAVLESENRYRSLVEQSPDTIIVLSEGKVGFINQAGARLLGAKAEEELVGMTIADFVHPDFIEAFERVTMPCGRANLGLTQRFESRFLRRDRHEMDVDVKAICIDYDGCSACQLAVRDISARKKAELEISEMNTELEQMLEDQSSQLDNLHEEMEVATQQLNMAQMATGALHNVKNVLNSLIVGTSMMGKILATSKIGKVSKVAQLLMENRSELGTFLSEGERGRFLPNFLASLAGSLEKEHDMIRQELHGLTKNLEHIKFSIQLQLASTRLSENSEFVSLNDLVEDALQVNASAINRLGVRIQRGGATMPPIPGNRHKVLQVIVNLISNALNALEDVSEGNRTLEIRLEMPDETKAAVTVIDSGIGISRENLDDIFNYGFTTRKAGHGFGLHSCLQLASEMGGNLSAHSDGMGRGASFTLTLPLPNMT